MKMKEANPGIKVLPSVGGWSLSDPFFALANDPALRARFVQSVKEFLLTYEVFDGVDIDWEFPGGEGVNPALGSSTDGEAFADLMRDLRAMLDEVEAETGRDMELSAAVSAGDAKIKRVNYAEAEKYMDYVFAMTYDFYGAWGTELGHHAALYDSANTGWNKASADDAINTLMDAGVPPEKLVVGVGMYGRGWSKVEGVQGDNPFSGHGTYSSSWQGTSVNKAPGTWEDGVLDYKDIRANYLGAEGTGINGFSYHYDQEAEAPYLWNPSSGTLITFDDGRSARAKAAYVQQHNLAGVFSWEIDSDNGEILNAMHQGLGHERRDGEEDIIDDTDSSSAGATTDSGNDNTSGNDSDNSSTDDSNSNTDTGSDTVADSGYSLTGSEVAAVEADLTSSELMQQVKASILTLPNDEVELIEPGRAANPSNVKRVESIISEADWQFLCPHRAPEYTYRKFLQAVGKFPAFCGDYEDGRDADQIARKALATMFAHFTQETGGHTHHWANPEWRQGLVHVREMGWSEGMRGGYNGECNPAVWQGQTWPCGTFDDGDFKSYFGRGAKQLSYNYNYGPFSEAMFGDVRVLLDHPELVADTWLNLASAVFFFVYPQPPKPSMLHVVDGTWQPNQRDLDNGLVPGFGVTTQIINGGVECGGSVEVAQSLNRMKYYQEFAHYLGVQVPADEVLGCKEMKQFDSQGSGALPIYWEKDWSWSAATPDGSANACQLVGYQTPFSAFKGGDYGRCVEHHFAVEIDYSR